MQEGNHLFKTIGTEGKTMFYSWFGAMHTRIDILLCNHPEVDCISLTQSIREEIRRIEQMMNRFDPSSELSRLNREAAGQEMPVRKELFNVLRNCTDYYKMTAGCFDITIQSHNDFRQGIDHIRFRPENGSIRFLHPDVQVDLNGLAKGYALDACIGILREKGMKDALLNFGNSSVFALGNHPQGEGWMISDPSDNKPRILRNECLSTSGNDSEQRAHIRLPRSGQYIRGKACISVVTPEATLGEVLSTAIFVAGASGIPDNFYNFGNS